MKVQSFVGNKAEVANEKHFNGRLSADQMKLLVSKVIRNAAYVGRSDRSNPGHAPARIIWGFYNDVMYGVVIDGNDIRKNKATVVSFYDVSSHTVEHKAKRFGMKPIKKGYAYVL